MSGAPLTVLFVAGFGRSGTTLLDNALGQLDGFFSVGEAAYVWDRCLGEDRLCSCRRPFSECPLWRPVVERAFGGRPPAIGPMVAARESLTPSRVVRAHLAGRSALDLPGVADYAESLGRLYRAVADETGAAVVVDSSKSPGHGFLLQSLPGVEPRTVHLVRDARAVAWSWQKRKVYDPTGDEPLYMSRHSPAKSARLWSVWNVAIELLWRRRPERYHRLRYESLAADPGTALERIVAFAGRPGAELPLVAPNRLRMGELHALAGNPSRFASGEVEVRRDEAWRDRQPAAHRRLVTLLTWPLLLRYGYLGRGRGAD